MRVNGRTKPTGEMKVRGPSLLFRRRPVGRSQAGVLATLRLHCLLVAG